MSDSERTEESDTAIESGVAAPNEHPEISNDNEEGREGDADNSDDDEEDDDDYEDSDDEDFVESLPPVIRKQVDQLKELNQQRDTFLEEYRKERALLELKYNELCKPLFEKRKEIVNGTKDVPPSETDGDGTNQSTDSTAPIQSDDTEKESDDTAPGIPEFWIVAMCNIEAVEELISERDKQCLEYLTDIACHDFDNGIGFILSFHFKENPFFTNQVLTKRYDVPNLLIEDEPTLKNVSGCDIDWKNNDMCLTFKTITKRQRNKKGKIRNVKKKERTGSFFHFFSTPKLPKITDMDEEEADAIEEAFEHDYDIAQQFRSYIIPKAVLWFTGEAIENVLEAFYEGDDSMISKQIKMEMASNLGESDKNPFPPTVNGAEEPECKQS